jgi:hypothetical protein
MLAKGTRIRWLSRGRQGRRVLEGIVRAHVPAGRKIHLPAHADPAKLRAALVNRVHARYLVEVLRRNARSGRPIASQWMAPKALTLDRVAKKIR